MDRFDKIKADLTRLPRISDKAVAAFYHSLPRLVFLVNEKFAVENKFCCGESLEKQMDLLKRMHKHFGDTLLAVYEFRLYDALAEEFAWLVSTLHYRGPGKEYFEKMLGAWIMAIHGTIEPSFSQELVQPLRLLGRNLSVFLERSDISAEAANESQKGFLRLLLEKRRREATDFVMSLAREGSHPDDLCSHLLMPTLRLIGLLWQKNQISATDEHAATEICRYIIFRLCDSIPRKEALPYKALVTCVPGEEHELGAEIVASHLENEGWTVYFLGHSAPEEDNIAAIVKHKPHVVFLTATLISNLPETVRLLRRIREIAPDVKILLGGSAALAASKAIGDVADGIIDEYRDAHPQALRLLSQNA